MRWSALTTPPPLRTPAPKHPLFTTDFFSTKSFGPGHLVGAGALVVGTIVLAKAFVAQGRADSARARSLAQAAAAPGPIAQANDRGQYGSPR